MGDKEAVVLGEVGSVHVLLFWRSSLVPIEVLVEAGGVAFLLLPLSIAVVLGRKAVLRFEVGVVILSAFHCRVPKGRHLTVPLLRPNFGEGLWPQARHVIGYHSGS